MAQILGGMDRHAVCKDIPAVVRGLLCEAKGIRADEVTWLPTIAEVERQFPSERESLLVSAKEPLRLGPSFLSPDYIEKQPGRRKCHRVGTCGTASRWLTKTNYPFTVPNQCDQQTFDVILSAIYPHLGDDANPTRRPTIPSSPSAS